MDSERSVAIGFQPSFIQGHILDWKCESSEVRWRQSDTASVLLLRAMRASGTRNATVTSRLSKPRKHRLILIDLIGLIPRYLCSTSTVRHILTYRHGNEHSLFELSF